MELIPGLPGLVLYFFKMKKKIKHFFTILQFLQGVVPTQIITRHFSS